VVSLASVALRRLGLERDPADVVLGGCWPPGTPLLTSAISSGLARTSPLSRVRVLSAPPVLGAVLLALDDLSAGRPARRLAVASASRSCANRWLTG